MHHFLISQEKWCISLSYLNSKHNKGLDGMPKRTFVGMEKDLEKKIKKIIQENLEEL